MFAPLLQLTDSALILTVLPVADWAVILTPSSNRFCRYPSPPAGILLSSCSLSIRKPLLIGSLSELPERDCWYVIAHGVGGRRGNSVKSIILRSICLSSSALSGGNASANFYVLRQCKCT